MHNVHIIAPPLACAPPPASRAAACSRAAAHPDPASLNASRSRRRQRARRTARHRPRREPPRNTPVRNETAAHPHRIAPGHRTTADPRPPRPTVSDKSHAPPEQPPFTCSAWATKSRNGTAAARGAGSGTRWSRSGTRPLRRRGAQAGRRQGDRAGLADVRAITVARVHAGIGGLNRVLGGGLVPGSLLLLGGSPGIGKSTLTSMALGNLAGAGRRTLYVSGDRRRAGLRLRAERLPGAALEVPVLAETDLDTVLATLDAERPEVAVVDSVQTLHAGDLTGAAGVQGQVREVADRITRLAKARDIAVLGHVTKEGAGHACSSTSSTACCSSKGERDQDLPHAAGAQEPLRVHERGRRVRDAPGRPRGGRGRERALRRRGDERARQRGARGDGGLAGRGPGPGLALGARAAAPGREVAVDRNRLALVLAVSGATRASGSGARTYSSITAASPSTSRAPIWRSRSRSQAPRGVAGRGCRWSRGREDVRRPPRSPASARSGSPVSCAPWGTPSGALPRPPSSGSRPSSHRSAQGRGATEAPTLRQALKAALGGAQRAPRGVSCAAGPDAVSGRAASRSIGLGFLALPR